MALGYLGRSGVMAAWLHAAKEDRIREAGWLSTRRDKLAKGPGSARR